MPFNGTADFSSALSAPPSLPGSESVNQSAESLLWAGIDREWPYFSSQNPSLLLCI